jgi:hypothetical protein
VVLGSTCAQCGAPTDGAYRCPACTLKAEQASEGAESTPHGEWQPSRPSPILVPAASLVTAIVDGARRGFVPRWLPKALLVFICGWIVFLFTWGLAHQ